MINTLVWWQWAILAAVPPAIVALYFLKLRRRPVEVPSTYLWRKTIEDLHVNSLWQRLRRSLLLLLQLLIVAVIILALLRPGYEAADLTGERFIFLVDNSASMSATDVGPTRLDEAKRQVEALIDQMEDGDEAMIISFSNIARAVQGYTSNRALLKQQLAAIGPTNRTTSLDEALRTAAGLANPGQSSYAEGDVAVAQAMEAQLFIFSDGKFPDVEGFALGNLYASEDAKPVFVPIGEATAANIGITAFSTERPENDPSTVQAFGRLENRGSEDTMVEATLYVDDTLYDAKRVELKAGESAGVTFDLPDSAMPGSGEAVLRLETGGSDALAIDDRAWVTVDPPRKARILFVSAGNPPWRDALSTPASDYLAQTTFITPVELPAYTQRLAAGQFDLVIYDQCQPVAAEAANAAGPGADESDTLTEGAMPQANTLFIGALPPVPGWSARAPLAAPGILDMERNHPLTRYLEMGDVLIAEAAPVQPPAGGSKLILSNDPAGGALLAIAPRGGFEDAVLAFPFQYEKDGSTFLNSNWPLRASFPVFVRNLIEYQRREPGSTSVRPGEPVPLAGSQVSDQLQVVTPSGATTEVVRSSLGTFQLSGVEEVGVYEVRSDGKRVGRFAANLLSEAESDIRPRVDDPIKVGYVEIAGQEGFHTGRRELWKWLLLLALGILFFEWYLYNRRVWL